MNDYCFINIDQEPTEAQLVQIPQFGFVTEKTIGHESNTKDLHRGGNLKRVYL